MFWSPAVRAAEPIPDAPAQALWALGDLPEGWLNVSRPLTPKDLKGRIVLVDFWTYCCINCMHILPDLAYLEEKFGDDLTVIGVHSAKFANERDTSNIRSAIQRYSIHHPVANDAKFKIWNAFGVRSWPTLVLIAPSGKIAHVYSGEGHRAELERDIAALRASYAGKFVHAPLPVALEQDKTPAMVLAFPGKLAYGDIDGVQTLIVSDSNHHRVVLADLGGGILKSFGSGEPGLKDGAAHDARFRNPQGVAYDGQGHIYVADTNNHAIRRIDLADDTVHTVAGTGTQGYERSAKGAPALRTPIASPWDVAFYPDAGHLAIAMAGTHQLWSLDLAKASLSVIAGNGRESIDDGAYPDNSLSQPSGLAVHNGKLYFVDAETSSLRVFDGKEIKTLIGTGLFDFGLKDGARNAALMQHSLGVFADTSGVYVADTYNHALRRYDPATGTLSTLAGDGKRGIADGDAKMAEFNEPNDVIRINGALYVADTNNHAIRVLHPETGKVETLPVMDKGPMVSETPFAPDELPNLRKADAATLVPEQAIRLTLALPKGWKLNAGAPSWLTLFRTDGKTPQVVKEYQTDALADATAALPELMTGASYRLQGTFYFCEAGKESLCLIQSHDQPLKTAKEGAKALSIALIPQAVTSPVPEPEE